jgi:hypothetical protein
MCINLNKGDNKMTTPINPSEIKHPAFFVPNVKDYEQLNFHLDEYVIHYLTENPDHNAEILLNYKNNHVAQVNFVEDPALVIKPIFKIGADIPFQIHWPLNRFNDVCNILRMGKGAKLTYNWKFNHVNLNTDSLLIGRGY